MMKKAAVLFCSIFVFSSIAVAVENVGNKTAKEKDVKTVSMKEEKEQYNKKVEMLAEKYKSASEQEKNSIRNEMKKLVSANTEKEIANKKEQIAKEKEKTAKMEKELSAIELDKEGYINKKVDSCLNKDSQKKPEKKREERKK